MYDADILKPNRKYNLPFGRLDPHVVEGRRELLQHYLWVSLSKSYTWQHLPFVEHNLKYTLNEIFYDLLVSKLSALISQDLANGSFKCFFHRRHTARL